MSRNLVVCLGNEPKRGTTNVARLYRMAVRNDSQIVDYDPGTALALTGMLRTVGVLRRGADNLVPCAMKLYAKGGQEDPSDADEKAFWKPRSEFTNTFGNRQFPDRFGPQVEFLGVWDTVKSIGWLNWRAQFQRARWPFTRRMPNVRHGRHAISIDERRRPYYHYRHSG